MGKTCTKGCGYCKDCQCSDCLYNIGKQGCNTCEEKRGPKYDCIVYVPYKKISLK